jgi:hypothetical protein
MVDRRRSLVLAAWLVRHGLRRRPADGRPRPDPAGEIAVDPYPMDLAAFVLQARAAAARRRVGG